MSKIDLFILLCGAPGAVAEPVFALCLKPESRTTFWCVQPAAFRFNCSACLTTPVGAAPSHTAEVALIIQISGDAYLVFCFLIHS